MAKIFKGGNPIMTDGAQDQANDFAEAYWGSLEAEKFFPIAFWKVKQMIAASNSKQIALRITDINNPLVVDGIWMVFEDSLADTLSDPVESGVHYFIIDDSYFDGTALITIPPNNITQVKGLWNANGTPENNIIRGRIGKDAADKYFAFFQAAECIIIGPGGGGGDGTSTGFKIPSP